MTDDVLTLQQAADELGVHYMTAYRYVRLGRMEASKHAGVWQVRRSALEHVRPRDAAGERDRRPPSRPAPWAARLESRLVAGDTSGAWGVVETAMAAGADLETIYLQVVTPAMVRIGERWENGELDVAVEHRASGIAMRLLGRIGPRFIRRGRTRGDVVLGAPAGEFHALPIAILGDLLRWRGWAVSDFGVDVPPSSVAEAVREVPDAIAVGLSAMSSSGLETLGDACVAARSAANPTALIVVGGRAILDDAHARSFGADIRAATPDEMHRLLESRNTASSVTPPL